MEALVLAADIVSGLSDNNTPVVFLTDARSVLDALQNSKQPHLQETLHNIRSQRTVIQWIPSHCGITGNENADRAAKQGADQQQEDNPVNVAEMTTIIKSLHKQPQMKDSYHQLTRKQQVIVFRLRTGHNRLNHHLSRKLRLVPSPLCPCGLEEQTTEHVLQSCPDLRELRDETWPEPTSLRGKLYGSVEALQRTANFILASKLQL